MKLAEYLTHDGLALADLVRRGDTTPQELAACARDAVTRANPTINAIIEVFDSPEAGGARDAPFYGVPFAVKDLILHMQGRRYEMGSRLAAGLVTPHDTHLMARFRRAGLCTIGRTTTPEFGYCATTEAVANGPTRNPWDPSRMPGGSSGGSAAAVAAGIVPMAHGNDGGGSIRIPAACCGLVGLKPTRGRTPIGPDVGEGLNGLAIEFAVTRTVRDSAALLDAVHGGEPGDPYLIAPPARPFLEEIASAPGRLRIACTDRSWSSVAVDPEVQAAYAQTMKWCAALGHEVIEARPEFDYEDYINASHIFWIANIAAAADQVAATAGREINPSTLEATTLASWESGNKLRASDLLRAMGVQNTVSRVVGAFFRDYDVLLTPTIASLPPPLGYLNANDASLDSFGWITRIFALCPFTALFNMTGQPAISLPLARTTANLPIGLHFAGRYGAEATLLKLARQFEQAHPWPLVAPLLRR